MVSFNRTELLTLRYWDISLEERPIARGRTYGWSHRVTVSKGHCLSRRHLFCIFLQNYPSLWQYGNETARYINRAVALKEVNVTAAFKPALGAKLRDKGEACLTRLYILEKVPQSAQNAPLDKTKFSKRHFPMETDTDGRKWSTGLLWIRHHSFRSLCPHIWGYILNILQQTVQLREGCSLSEQGTLMWTLSSVVFTTLWKGAAKGMVNLCSKGLLSLILSLMFNKHVY